jgi:hypothetical protein
MEEEILIFFLKKGMKFVRPSNRKKCLVIQRNAALE